ncbi:MAG: hypothetical protein ACI87E_003348, partial [Mariniblastus sp.]
PVKGWVDSRNDCRGDARETAITGAAGLYFRQWQGIEGT